jgi:hypothetical protein
VCVCVCVCVCVFLIQVFIVTPSPKERKVCLFVSWVVQKNVCHQIFDSSLVSSAKAKSCKFKRLLGANHGHKVNTM